VGLTVAGSSAFAETALAIGELRARLPAAVQLWVGGAGASLLGELPAGVLGLPELEGLEPALASL
jgi:hypothetical protein